MQLYWGVAGTNTTSTEAVRVTSGNLEFSRSAVLTLVPPIEAKYEDVVSLYSQSPDRYVLRGESMQSRSINLRVTDCTFQNAYWYGAGALKWNGSTSSTTEIYNSHFNYYHDAVDLRNMHSGNFSKNVLRENTNHAVQLYSVNNFSFDANTVQATQGANATSLWISNSSGITTTGNVLTNTGGTAIYVDQMVSNASITRNFIHASGGNAIQLGSSVSSTSITDITITENILAQNAGWAIEAAFVDGLQIIGNTLHNNRQFNGFQHAFNQINALEAQGNYWDTDFSQDEIGNPKMFGSNIAVYDFATGMQQAVKSYTTPLASSEYLSALPTGQNDSEAWLRSLELGTGDIEVPTGGIVLDRVVTITNPRRIIGQGRTVLVSGIGEIVVNMQEPDSVFAIEDATVIWQRTIQDVESFNAISIRKGGLSLIDNNVFTDVDRPTSWYQNDPISDPNFVTTAQQVAKSWLIDTSSDSAEIITSHLHLINNNFSNARWYSTGLLYSAQNEIVEDAFISGNNINYFHGAIYLHGADGAVIENNRLYRNSFGNVVLRQSDSAVVRGNIIEFAGNGTSGDAATLQSLSNLQFDHNVISGPSCYGIWLLDDIDTAIFEENVVHAGITSGFRFESSLNNPLFENLIVENNLFSHNNSWAFSGQDASFVTLHGNVLQSNYRDSWSLQHHFWKVENLTADNNLQFSGNAAAELLSYFSVGARPYDIWSEGQGVAILGNTLSIVGTNDNDRFDLLPDENKVHVARNGDWRTFSLSEISALQIDGGLGTDTVVVQTDANTISVLLRPGSLQVEGATFSLSSAAENHTIYGNQELVAVAYAREEQDWLYASPNYIRMVGSNYENFASGFAVAAVFGQGNNDVAVVQDSSGNDQFYADAHTTCMATPANTNTTLNFATVLASSNAGGVDSATLSTSGNLAVAQSASVTQVRNSSVFVQASNFESVNLTGTSDATSCTSFSNLALPPTIVNGQVWNDGDMDGVFANSETTIESRWVYVDLNSNGFLDDDEPSTLTNPLGQYSLSVSLHNLTDSIDIRVIEEPDWYTGFTTLNVTAGAVFDNVNLPSWSLYELQGRSLIVRGTPDSDTITLDASRTTNS